MYLPPPAIVTCSSDSIITSIFSLLILKFDISKIYKSLLGKVIVIYEAITERVHFSTAKEMTGSADVCLFFPVKEYMT